MEKETQNQSALKSTAKNNLKTQHGFNRAVPSIGIVAVTDENTRNFLLEGLSEIGLAAVVIGKSGDIEFKNISFVDNINNNSLIGFDFFIYDNEFDSIDVVKYMGAGIVPIMPLENTYSGIIKDFNPMRFEGNGFLWKGKSAFCIFEKVITYLENIKFPEDKRVLLKNVVSTF